jgi:hypothetical protein
MWRNELPQKNTIIDEWDRWAKNNIAAGQRPKEVKAIAFYGYLSIEKPRLLGFDFAGDGVANGEDPASAGGKDF